MFGVYPDVENVWCAFKMLVKGQKETAGRVFTRIGFLSADYIVM